MSAANQKLVRENILLPVLRSFIHSLSPSSFSVHLPHIHCVWSPVLGSRKERWARHVPALEEYGLCINSNMVSDEWWQPSFIQECSLPLPFIQSTKESPIISNPVSPLSVLLPCSWRGGSIHIIWRLKLRWPGRTASTVGTEVVKTPMGKRCLRQLVGRGRGGGSKNGCEQILP